jgi:adenylate cyclase
LAVLGRTTATFLRDYDAARELVDRAVSLNPNAAYAWLHRGWTYLDSGQPEEALRSFERAIRLSPFDPLLDWSLTGMGFALLGRGRLEEAVVSARKALQVNPAFGGAYRCLAAALALLDRDAEARETVNRLLAIEPSFRISDLAARANLRDQTLLDALRKAGFPE